MKTTYWKPWHENLLKVWNLTFDLCFKAKWRHHTKSVLISLLLLVLGLHNVKTVQGKSWPTNLFAVKNFGLILKNKMGAIVNCLKIIKVLKILILQLASSNLYKRDMARKASLIVTWPCFSCTGSENKSKVVFNCK